MSSIDSATEPKSELEILRRCTAMLEELLPDDWGVSSVAEKLPGPGPDGQLDVVGPDGEPVRYLVEVKRLLTRRDVPKLYDQVARWAQAENLGLTRVLVMSRYLAPSVREALAKSSVSYVDATGNTMITASRPALFVRNQGSDSDPWRGPGRPRGSLKGEPAARVVRTLVRSQRAWGARDLVTASGASTGATYRVLEFLQDEELVERTDEGLYRLVDWPRLLRRWSQDYGFLRNNRTQNFVDPRGIPALLKRIAGSDRERYAITGSIAAAQWAPYAPARAALIYVDNAVEAAAQWGLIPTESGSNVILAEPAYDVVFDSTITTTDGYTIVPPEQLAVDLLTGPGRNPAEGEELIQWMQGNESEWRDG
jgi:hypothetical protein